MTATVLPTTLCSLLFGIPISREEFHLACGRNPRSDYLDTLLGEDDPEYVWDTSYSAIASAAESLIDAAGTLGSKVYRQATLDDFSDATNKFKVVILLAHFRGFTFTKKDFLVSVNDLITRVRARGHSVFDHFKIEPVNDSDFIDTLNKAVLNRELLDYMPSVVAGAGRLSAPVGRVLCRDLLDEAFWGMVSPGNQVELLDGLHTPGELESALAPRFCGELDLALCNSAALSTYIDLRRRNLVHHLHWPDLVLPAPQLLLIAEALRRFSRSGGSYIKTRLHLESEIVQLDWSAQ